MSVELVIGSIEREAARRSKAARAAYRDGMTAAQGVLKDEQKRLAGIELEELKSIERWRINMISTADPSQPVTMADLRSLKRKRSSDEMRMVRNIRKIGA